MNLILFCTAFILQFVGHRIGDYLFQTDMQAQNKANALWSWARTKHCFVYSVTIAALTLFAFDYWLAAAVFLITFIEHYIIDSRLPILWYKDTLENIVGNKGFDISKLPFFVLIEIDQTVHYTRIFIISLLIGYGVLT